MTIETDTIILKRHSDGIWKLLQIISTFKYGFSEPQAHEGTVERGSLHFLASLRLYLSYVVGPELL